MRPIACRSLLMTCSLIPERYARASECGADIGTVDLEDSVPPDRKEEARRLVVRYLASPFSGGSARAVRINSLRCEDGLRDLLALLDSGVRPDILFLPKVESAEEPVLVDQILGGRWPSTVVLATIETARGLAAVEEIAAPGTPRLWGLIFGAFDYSVDVGCSLEWEDLLYARSRLLAAAARAGLPLIDAPCFDLEDGQKLAAEVARGRRMGFAGKAAVHPRQLAAINAGFTPGEDAISEALEILAATEVSQGGICVVRGRMIGPPSVRMARRLLANAQRLPSPRAAEQRVVAGGGR